MPREVVIVTPSRKGELVGPIRGAEEVLFWRRQEVTRSGLAMAGSQSEGQFKSV